MRKFLLLLCALLGTVGAWATDVQVTWESYAGWTRNNVASVWWVGITTPGTTSDTYKMSSFQFAQETGYGAATRYACISTTAPTTSGAVLDENDVLGVSTNSVTANATAYFTYNLAEEIELQGATTYYMVFITSNTPTNGKYEVSNQRVSLNTSYGSYAAGTMASNGNLQSSWTPGFKATLTTSAVYTVNYTSYSTYNGNEIGSGKFEDVVGTIAAPSYDGYDFDHATDAEGNAVSLTDAITSNVTYKLYYKPFVNVTYNVVIDATVVVSKQAKSYIGDATAMPTGFTNAFVTLSDADVATILPTTTEVNYTGTVKTLPFTLSSSYNDATWYYMTIRNGSKYVAVSETTPYPNSASQTTSDEGQWAFIGNPYSLKVINKSAEGKYLVNEGTGTNNAITMQDTEFGWVMGNAGGNGFTLRTSLDGNIYAHDYSSALATWNSTAGATDAGSYFQVSAVPDNYYNLVEAEVIPFLMDGEGNPSTTIGKLFGLSSAAASSIVSTYMTQLNNQQFTQAEYEAIVAAKDAGILYPEDGKYYLIKNVSNGKYLRATGMARGSIYADVEAANITAASIVKASIRDGRTFLGAEGAEFSWVYGTGKSYAAFMEASGKKAVFTINTPGQVAFAHGLGNLEGDYASYTNSSYYEVNSDGIVVGSNGPTDATAQWIFEEVSDITISLNAIDGKSYATTYLPFGVNLDGDVKAYALTEQTFGAENYAVPAEIGQAVPAGSAVMLVSESGATSVTATIDNTIPANNIANSLQGSYFASTPSAYVLNALNGEVGFYALNGTLAANRAYLPKTNEVKGFRIMWGNTDAITSVDAKQDAKNATIYNLAGQRVNAAQKGVFIVNGKKVVLK